METMEHNEATPEKCDCPGCYLNEKYEADYEAYKKLLPYVTFEMTAGDSTKVERWLNEMQKKGYEMTAAHNGIVIMRAIPPQGITQRDIIMEVLRRKKANEVGGTADFPETIGQMQ